MFEFTLHVKVEWYYNFYLISSKSISILISIPIKETIKTNTMMSLPKTVLQLLYLIQMELHWSQTYFHKGSFWSPAANNILHTFHKLN